MILITGASGLVGQYAAKALLDAGYSVRAIRRPQSRLPELLHNSSALEWVEADILDPLSLDRAIEGCLAVIHAAGLVSYQPRDKEELYRINVEGTANVVNACLRTGVKRLIHVSSVAAIGRPKGATETNESQAWEPSEHHTEYARSKQAAELEVWRGQAEGLQVSILNPSVVLGIGDWQRSSGQLIRYVWEEKPFFIHGMFNWIDVRDLASLLVRCLEDEKSIGQRFIASAGCLSYQDFFRQLAAQLGKRPPYIGVGKTALRFVSTFGFLQRLLLAGPSLVTSETAKLAGSRLCFRNDKVAEAFKFTFRPLPETLKWLSKALKSTNSSIH